ncbi:MAG TPA: LysM peptidoglycan-binding domain-containing protein [Gemmatimonadaceae bacterium]|nr:LysM peptidoglycan-binding domain-containing protein [Gemmatimonadaceae bacterium]
MRRRRRRVPRPAVYMLGFAALIALAIIAQLVVHMIRTDPRDSRAIAERELRLNTLQPGERVLRMVSVFKRPAIDYFRATRGLLVLTNQRLLYLGLEPRDLLAAPDLPPTFEQRDFPIDTLVHVSTGRTFFGIAKAIVISTPTETLKLGVPSAAWPQANLIVMGMSVRHDRAVALSAQQRAMLARAEAQRRAAEAARRKAKFYTVKRGDALGSIATIWNTTPDKLQTWNRLPTNKIRVGQVLLVRPAL